MATGNVNVTTPLSLAIEHTRRLLFQPFDLSRWFVIGFGAWLATLGEGGFNFNFNLPGRQQQHGDLRKVFEHAREYVMANLVWIIPVVVIVILLLMAIGVAVIWVSSRGKFVFLHQMVTGRAEIGEPWRRAEAPGWSLFWFRLVLGVIGMLAMLPLIAGGVYIGVKMYRAGVPDAAGILTLVGLVLVFLVVSIVWFLVMKFTDDFVVPVMSLRRCECLPAWREVGQLMRANAGNFVNYVLFQIVIGLATGALVIFLVIATCCIAGCFLIIPYLGTVLLLPIVAFKRAYSLHYLAQYGAEYDVFATPVAEV